MEFSPSELFVIVHSPRWTPAIVVDGLLYTSEIEAREAMSRLDHDDVRVTTLNRFLYDYTSDIVMQDKQVDFSQMLATDMMRIA